MTLPASGALSISQISTELTRTSSATTSLGEYSSRCLIGRSPSSNSSMSHFYQASIDLTNYGFVLDDVVVPGGPAYAGVSFLTDGTIIGAGNGTTVPSHWFGDGLYEATSSGIGNNYWIKFIWWGPSAPDAGVSNNTIYALSSNVTISWSAINTAKAAALTVFIYSDSSGTNLARRAINISVDADGSNI